VSCPHYELEKINHSADINGEKSPELMSLAASHAVDTWNLEPLIFVGEN
jgi:hypothetical protein